MVPSLYGCLSYSRHNWSRYFYWASHIISSLPIYATFCLIQALIRQTCWLNFSLPLDPILHDCTSGSLRGSSLWPSDDLSLFCASSDEAFPGHQECTGEIFFYFPSLLHRRHAAFYYVTYDFFDFCHWPGWNQCHRLEKRLYFYLATIHLCPLSWFDYALV